jgi:choline dehydrogenase-like flavoprotein
VTRLETDPIGRSVERVVVDRDGSREEYTADVVVLSAGAINSAALLLGSANDRHPDGLGNGSGVVGRHLMMHNNSSLLAFSKIPNPTKFQKTVGFNDWYFGADDFDFPLGGIQMNGKSERVLVAFDAPDAKDPDELAKHTIDFWLTTEDLPMPHNQVLVDRDGNISLRYRATNLAAHQRLRDKFTGLLDAIQCSQDVIEGESYAGGRLGIGGVAHQNGTIRCGSDPSSSALDASCKLHELDNVYVADSSFFVSSAAVNPTLTIIANALRIADTIAERLGTSTSVRLDNAVPAQRQLPILANA